MIRSVILTYGNGSIKGVVEPFYIIEKNYILFVLFPSLPQQRAGLNKPVMVNPSQTTGKEFWINTVHLDGATSLHAAVANPLSAHTPLHPAEVPPQSRLYLQEGSS